MMERIRRLGAAIVPALLWVGIPPAPAHHGNVLSHGGTILTAIATYKGSIQSGKVLAVGEGASRVLLRRPRMAFLSLSPSPDGRRVAALTCCSPATGGIWIFNRDGSDLHRLVPLPHSPCGNPLTAESIVWSPGGRRLAYVVYLPSDAIRGCSPGVHDLMGVWVTPSDRPRSRLVEFENYVLSGPPVSWSPDGRTLAVNSGNDGPAVHALAVNSGNDGPAVHALDVATGASRPLVRGGYAGIYAPVTGALAYVTTGSKPGGVSRIWVAGAQGRRRHILVSTSLGLADSPLLWSPNGRSLAYVTDTGSLYRRGARTLSVAGSVAHTPRTLVVAGDGAIDSPAWSPDGQTIAYSGAASCPCRGESSSGPGTAIFTVDVATGVRHTLVKGGRLFAGLPSPSDVTSIAWAVR